MMAVLLTNCSDLAEIFGFMEVFDFTILGVQLNIYDGRHGSFWFYHFGGPVERL